MADESIAIATLFINSRNIYNAFIFSYQLRVADSEKGVWLERSSVVPKKGVKRVAWKMPIVDNFLCFDLRTGGYAIGTFEIFLHACLITFAGYRLTHSLAHATSNYIEYLTFDCNFILFYVLVVLVMLMGEIVIYSLSVFTSVFLIVGTSRVRH